MSRVKRGMATKKRHKRLLKQTKGYWGQRSNIFRRARETLMRALTFAFAGRKCRKRDFRSLFITRINAACRLHNTAYNRFIHALNENNVKLNRKFLSQLAVFEPNAFENLVKLTKK